MKPPHPPQRRPVALEARPVGGYGLWHVLTPEGRFVAGGCTKERAEQNARLALAKARSLGARPKARGE